MKQCDTELLNLGMNIIKISITLRGKSTIHKKENSEVCGRIDHKQ